MKIRLITAACAALSVMMSVAPGSQAAVSVIGGGLASDCYQAVEFRRVSPQKSLEICNMALTYKSLSRRNRAATYVNRGILHMREASFDRALVDFERSLSLDPALLEAKVNLGAALYNLGRFEEALAALNEGVAAEDLNARATGFYNRGLTHERLGDLQAAYWDYRTAFDTNPAFTDAARQLERFTVVEREG